MKEVRSAYLKVITLFSIIILSACATQLAPNYDKSLFDGITQTNTRIMELFASISAGTEPNNFSEREANYNALIGSVDALEMQSKARPVPENIITEKVNQFLKSRDIKQLPDGIAPSADSLKEVSKNLVKMRDVDKINGLKPGAISVFKSAVVISMDQALTYESFLER